MVVSACQVQPFPGCESLRYLRFHGPIIGPRLASPGTMASADSCSRTAAIAGRRPTVVGGLGLQVSLSKDVNSCCTTGPFISGTEHRAALCRANSPAPSTLLLLVMRGSLTVFLHRGLSPH